MNLKGCLLLFALIFSFHGLYAQKFSDNTELKLLNKYAKDFDIRFSSDAQWEKHIKDIVRYVSDYPIKNLAIHDLFYTRFIDTITVNGVRVRHALHFDPLREEYDSLPDLCVIREFFYKFCSTAKLELQERNQHPPNKKVTYKTGLQKFLKLSPVSSIAEIESRSEKLKQKDSLIKVYQLLASYYWYEFSNKAYGEKNYEKYIYYLHRLLLLYEGDQKTQDNILIELTQTEWVNGIDNFYGYEKQLSLAIRLYEDATKSQSLQYLHQERNRILRILAEMWFCEQKQKSLSDYDLDLLEAVFINLLHKELYSKDKVFLQTRFELIGRYLDILNKQEKRFGQEIEKSYLLASILAFKEKNYHDLLLYTHHYSMTLSTNNNKSVPIDQYLILFTEAWDNFIQLTDAFYYGDWYQTQFARFDRYYYQYQFFIKNKSIVTKIDYNEQPLYSLYYMAIDSAIIISNSLMPVNRYYLSQYKEMLTHASEIEKQRDAYPIWKYRRDAAIELKDSISVNLYDSLLKTGDIANSYKILKIASDLPEYNDLWKYQAILKGELDAVKDQSQWQSDSFYTFQREVQKKISAKELKQKNDSLEISNNNLKIIDASFRTSQNKLAITENERQTTANWLYVLIALFFVFVSGFAILSLNSKSKRQELELMVNSTSINTHFVKNLLGGPIEENIRKNDIQLLSDINKRINNFIKKHHEITNYQNKVILLSDEILYLNQYIDLQCLRFIDQLSTKPVIEHETLCDDDFEDSIPPMFIQPFLENAFEHGLKNSGTVIGIEFKKHKKDLIVTIHNDGRLFEESDLDLYNSKKKILKTKTNNALINTLRRILLHNGEKIDVILQQLLHLAQKITLQKSTYGKTRKISWNIQNCKNEYVEVTLIFKSLFRYA